MRQFGCDLFSGNLEVLPWGLFCFLFCAVVGTARRGLKAQGEGKATALG